jgi:phage terminase Nu1 subunit (DNA packaging protein)
LVNAHKEALRGRLDAEMKVETLQRATGAVIGTDLARSIMSRYMTTIRNLMEGLPSSLCRRANPTDPELAKEVITEGIEKVIAVIHKTKGSFGETKLLDERKEKEVKQQDEQEKRSDIPLS